MATNSRLQSALSRARLAGVPKATVERSLSKDAGVDDLVSQTYEGYGPGGVAFVVEALTDNHKRTVQQLRHMFDKAGGAWRLGWKGWGRGEGGGGLCRTRGSGTASWLPAHGPCREPGHERQRDVDVRARCTRAGEAVDRRGGSAVGKSTLFCGWWLTSADRRRGARTRRTRARSLMPYSKLTWTLRLTRRTWLSRFVPKAGREGRGRGGCAPHCDALRGSLTAASSRLAA